MDEEPQPSTGQDELCGALSKADTMENIIVQWGILDSFCRCKTELGEAHEVEQQ